MFIHWLQDDPQYFFSVCITVIVSVCVHELCHGLAAIALGDRTGHMTLNPLKHMGGMSLILLLAAGIAWGSMPVNPSRLRGKYGRALVAVAGPAANVVMALLGIVAVGLWKRSNLDVDDAPPLVNFLWIFGYVNIALAIFNLLPVPPLDGSRIVANFSSAYVQMVGKLQASGQMMVPFLIIFFFAGKFIYPISDYARTAILRWTIQY
jgi:Zn-dependent protease